MTNRWLQLYLQDHDAGAAAGLALAGRVARGRGDPRVHAAVKQLRIQIAEDRRGLRRMMRSVGCAPTGSNVLSPSPEKWSVDSHRMVDWSAGRRSATLWNLRPSHLGCTGQSVGLAGPAGSQPPGAVTGPDDLGAAPLSRRRSTKSARSVAQTGSLPSSDCRTARHREGSATVTATICSPHRVQGRGNESVREPVHHPTNQGPSAGSEMGADQDEFVT